MSNFKQTVFVCPTCGYVETALSNLKHGPLRGVPTCSHENHVDWGKQDFPEGWTPMVRAASVPLVEARVALLHYMEEASETRYAAGWLIDLEHALVGDSTYDALVRACGGTWTGHNDFEEGWTP